MTHHTLLSNPLFLLTFVVLIHLQLISCAGKRSVAGSIQNMPMLTEDTIAIVKAAGEVSGSYKGERFRGRIAIVYDPGKSFNCDIYSSFAHSIASIVSDNDSAEISIGEQEYGIGVNDSISFLPFFTTFPFIFNDFARIISGRMINKECLSGYLDALEAHQEEKVFRYQCDSASVSCAVSKRGRKIKSIECKALRGVRWTITYSSFKNGLSRQIQYAGDEKNSFSLKFDTMTY